MKVSDHLFKKIKEQMRIIYITKKKPRQKIKLDPLDPEDLNADLDVVKSWSEDNQNLYNLLLENGMAEYICNEEYLNEFYEHLAFRSANLSIIDPETNRLSNLKILNLFQNNIQTIQNIPQSCQELYLDFNRICKINTPEKLNIQLLSISHNSINDKTFKNIIKNMPSLRCLNISYNRISDIRAFTSYLKSCEKLKMLISRNNPISLLPIYWKYITDEISLNYFDNEKYVKAQQEKIPQPVEEKKQEKKEQKKQQKKDPKKKGGKEPEKPPEPVQEKVQVKVQEPKELTEDDFSICKTEIKINNFENFSGILGDPSLFTQENLDPKQTQSSFWLQWCFLGENGSNYQNRIALEQATIDGDENRLDFEFLLQKQFQISYEAMKQFNEGLTIVVYQEYPVIKTDPQSGQQKVQVNEESEIKMEKKPIGGTFVKLQNFHKMKEKKLSRKFNLFQNQVLKEPFFKKPLANEEQLIKENRIKFDAKLAEIEEERRKKQEEEEASKKQKKGGKDSKKAAEKKGAKKDAKEPAVEKKNVEKCTYEQDEKEYCYFGEGKMHKSLKEQIGVKIDFV